MKKNLLTLLVVLALVLTAFAPMVGAQGDLNKDAKLTLWLPDNSASAVMPEGTTVNDNPFINAIREKTGYANLEVELISEGATQMNMLMAGGEYPSAIYVNSDRAFFLQYLTEGLWAPVDEAVAAYGPAISELMTDAVLASTQGEDGQHYAIAMPLHTSYQGEYFGSSMMYDTAVLNELGLEVPTNADELYNVLKTVKEKTDLIPLSLVGTDAETIKSMFGMWTNYTIGEDGKIVNTAREYYKDFVTYMNKLYSEGLLDPESLYQTSTERDEKVVSGKTFMIHESVWCKSLRQSVVANGGEWTWDYLPALENIDGTKGNANPFPTSNIWMFPSPTADQMNEVVDLINTFLTDKELETFVNYGEEGVHFYYDDNGTIQSINDNGEYDSIMYKIIYRLWFKPDVWLNNAILGDFMPEIEQYVAAYDMTNENVWGYMPTSEASIEYKSSCDDIMNEYRDKIIVGELPVDAVDEMFEKMDASGYTEIEAACQEWYDTTGAGLAVSLGLVK